MKMLQEHDPTKAEKIDGVMAKFEGRETELLEKMILRYESGNKEEPKSVVKPTDLESAAPPDDGRPKSRQDLAMEKHMARMKRIKASASKG